MSKKLVAKVAVLTLAVAGLSLMAAAQVVNSGPQSIALNATLAESLTVSLSANAVSFNLAPGSATNAGSTNITATTAWVLKPGRTTVTVDAYFASTVALNDNSTPANNIPSSAFQISDNGGAFKPCNGLTAYGTNTGVNLEKITITGSNKNANQTDNMSFNIDLSSMPQLPAGTYQGTLNIQAQATP